MGKKQRIYFIQFNTEFGYIGKQFEFDIKLFALDRRMKYSLQTTL
jgi:hypothetical protein